MTHRHGSPYDRGAADSYYRRPRNPHYYTDKTYLSPRVDKKDMTPDEIKEYHAGYSANEKAGDFKDYGIDRDDWDDDYDNEEGEEEEEEDEL